jgi:hypothetical protein
MLGLAALLLASAVVPTALAAPSGQSPGWVYLGPPQWDTARPWFQQQVVVQPTAAVFQRVPGVQLGSVPVTVLAPTGVVDTVAVPTVVSTFQQTILPEVVEVVPVDTLRNGVQVLRVEPNLIVPVAPQLYCPFDAAWTCQSLATQLALRRPGFTTVTLNGPLGAGVYVAYQV